MSQYDNTNSGVLFSNRDAKANNERAPDYKGSINVDGVDYWLSAWIKEGKPGTKLEGKRFMSLSATPKPATQPAAYADAPAPAPSPAPRRPTQAEQDARAIAERRQQERAAPVRSGTRFDDMDDDIPF